MEGLMCALEYPSAPEREGPTFHFIFRMTCYHLTVVLLVLSSGILSTLQKCSEYSW